MISTLFSAFLCGFGVAPAGSAASFQDSVAPARESADETTSAGRITLEQTNRGSGEPILGFRPEMASVRWAEDGRMLRLGSGDDVVLIDPMTGEESALPESDADDDDGERSGRRGDRRGRRGAQSELEKSLEEDGEVRLARTSPNGKWLTFIRENDLLIASTETEEVRAITEDGSPEQFNGVLDWVYQEEIYGRGDFQGHFWSPDSAHTAYIALDESPVHEFVVVDHLDPAHFRVEPEVTNYPKVGDPNPIPRVGIASVATAETVWVDLSRYDGQEILIVRVGWTPSGDRALIYVQDRIQTWADLLSVDPATGEGELLIREESDAWTARPDDPIWLEDGSFLWKSHRTGPTHVYRYGADGKLMNAVTQGPWNVTGIEHVDEPTDDSPGHLFFQSTEGGAINSNLYRIALDGTGFTRLTRGDGSHRVTWNEDRTMFIDSLSSLTNPGEVRVSDADGNVLRTVATATVPDAEEYSVGTWELHEVAARDGMMLDVAVLKPADFDPSKSYAVWVSTYSGPAAPSVSNRWSGSAFFHFLGQNEIIVLRSNVRTSTRKGPGATAALYRRMGLQEVEDMSDVVDWLTANEWADGDRVGITGYSFGGTMTANCLLRTDKFKLGIAGGGVYDWRMYDSIYTERYMRTPEDNEEGFEKTSCLRQAANLTGFLHMHHGIMDDNVHVQNMFQMAYALMQAGKLNWSMMAYPQTRHGIRNGKLSWHARKYEWELIQKYLLDRSS